MMHNHYPASPDRIDFGEPSAEFKKEIAKVISSIVSFFIVYILLIIASLILSVACFFAGIAIMKALTNLTGILAGLGLMCVGGSVVFFLIKFIFASTRNENPDRLEIKETDQPELFAFVRQLTEDTQTKFPKKIFISPSVNASVFYNSSFWSMMLPVKKNLEIGLGLVNTLNLSEFKAVMAHEFGHFSQKSMKLGSFTYNVNRVIYNMLYENTGYQKFLSSLGSISWILSLFMSLTIQIARLIQSILRSMYGFINKNYLSLSRQMEFNADRIAAGVAGSNNLVSALNRIEIGHGCYNTALDKANEMLKEKMMTQNIFNDQLTVMQKFAGEHQLPLVNGLPQVTRNFLQSFSVSRINFKDQWASHPTTKEREEELNKANIILEPERESAWVLFSDAAAIQHKITQHIYRDVPSTDQLQPYDNSTFREKYDEEQAKYKLPPIYKGYYSNRFINMSDWNPDNGIFDTTASWEDIFTNENCNLPALIKMNEQDHETLGAIKDKRIDIKSFDFDGEKYETSEAPILLEKLEAELKSQKELLSDLDKKVYGFFLKTASLKNNDAESLATSYKQYRALSMQADEFLSVADSIIQLIIPFYHGGIKIEQVQGDVAVLKNDYEIKLKAKLKATCDDPAIVLKLDPKLQEQIQSFLTKEYYYFHGQSFESDALNSLYDICVGTGNALNEIKFASYKSLLEKQLQLAGIPHSV